MMICKKSTRYFYIIIIIHLVTPSKVNRKEITVEEGGTVSMVWKLKMKENLRCTILENSKEKPIFFIPPLIVNNKAMKSRYGQNKYGNRISGWKDAYDEDLMLLNITIKNVLWEDNNIYSCHRHPERKDITSITLKVLTKMRLRAGKFNATLNVKDRNTDTTITLCGNPKPKLLWYFEEHIFVADSKHQIRDCFVYHQKFSTESQKLCGHTIKYIATGYKSNLSGTTKLAFNLKTEIPREVKTTKLSDYCFMIRWYNPNIGFCNVQIFSQVRIVNKYNSYTEIYNTTGNVVELCMLDKYETYDVSVRTILNNQKSFWTYSVIAEKATKVNIRHRIIIIIVTMTGITLLAILFGIIWFKCSAKYASKNLANHHKNCNVIRYRSLDVLDQTTNEYTENLLNPDANNESPSSPNKKRLSSYEEYYEDMNELHLKRNDEKKNIASYDKLQLKPHHEQNKTLNGNDDNEKMRENLLDTYDTLNRQDANKMENKVHPNSLSGDRLADSTKIPKQLNTNINIPPFNTLPRPNKPNANAMYDTLPCRTLPPPIVTPRPPSLRPDYTINKNNTPLTHSKMIKSDNRDIKESIMNDEEESEYHVPNPNHINNIANNSQTDKDASEYYKTPNNTLPNSNEEVYKIPSDINMNNKGDYKVPSQYLKGDGRDNFHSNSDLTEDSIYENVSETQGNKLVT